MIATTIAMMVEAPTTSSVAAVGTAATRRQKRVEEANGTGVQVVVS